jgi:uncharacterized protein (DUF1810 family)
MTDPFNLQRFLDAQSSVYPIVLDELRRGRKQSHWMWFIFPQLVGLGHSAMAHRFAIASREEAVAYLGHGLLGSRLRECTALINAVEGRTIMEILGSPDDLKFHSSMTLFDAVSSYPKFAVVADPRFVWHPLSAILCAFSNGHDLLNEASLPELLEIRVLRINQDRACGFEVPAMAEDCARDRRESQPLRRSM